MLDNKYNFKERESFWQNYWQDNDIYKYTPGEKETYSIDTPPPTVNGKIHLGHLSSYTHIEIIARHKRMQGIPVYFPFGYDDNGLPTERYVEKKNNIKAHEMSREEFIDLCIKERNELEKDFHSLYKSAGFSCNLKDTYSSISKNTQKISQKSFIDLYKKGYIYHAESPALWCWECATAVAQSELESADVDSHFNYIKFYIEGENDFVTIGTTRPEMLSACVCVFINPKDKKNAHLLNKRLIVPHYNFSVPVYADDLVDMEKGSGVVMCCTFGDNVDKEWQRKHNLPIKEAFNNHGRMTALAGKLEGMPIKRARKEIIEILKQEDLFIKQDEITHAVSTHERCGTPIEIVVKKQWFIDVLTHKDRLYQAGLDLNWYPKSMRARYLNWVENLQWNWCISRQRYFGVPFPVWFNKKTGEVILADEDQLPVNPLVDMPKGVNPEDLEFIEPEVDVMDTWATSSLTPQISLDLLTNKGLSDYMIPMNLRPNAHDNIRVWDFYTIVKSLYHFDKLPWKDLMISGYVTSPTGGKLAKSKSNSIKSPQEIIAEYSADVTRYWAGSLSLGKDTSFSLDSFDTGRKLQNKIWNASRFVLSFLEDYTPRQVELLPMDKWILNKLKKLQTNFEKLLNKYEIALALNELESFFWDFCDNYIEIVKIRLYQPEVYGYEAKESAQYASYHVLLAMLKMFSIYMPHITEEIYMSYFVKHENAKSIHISKYLNLNIKPDETLLENAKEVIEIVTEIRKAKSIAQVSMKTLVEKLTVASHNIDFIKSVEQDIRAVGNVKEIEYISGDFKVEVGNLIVVPKETQTA